MLLEIPVGSYILLDIIFQMIIRQVTLSQQAGIRCIIFDTDFAALFLGDDSGVVTVVSITPNMVSVCNSILTLQS